VSLSKIAVVIDDGLFSTSASEVLSLA